MNPENSSINLSGEPNSGKNKFHNMSLDQTERYATFGGQKVSDRNNQNHNMTTINNNN